MVPLGELEGGSYDKLFLLVGSGFFRHHCFRYHWVGYLSHCGRRQR